MLSLTFSFLISNFLIFKSKGAKELKPGDLIEIFRGIFQHWAVYIGDGYVVHLTAIGESFLYFAVPVL